MTYNKQENNVSDTIFNGVRSMVKRRSTPWVGTMSDLGEVLENRFSAAQLPGSASALRVSLNRVINRLRNAGISVRFTRATDRTRTRLVEFVTRY